ncbi:MAG TPA: type II 3-dehydroquinate dehydratase [Ignavibacteriaceae bacterium]|nr:type II 3-dehydroquinate dehydratase [Ignavibacteriaceae bacterium]
MKILVINGPNLNLLGKRNKNHYGNLSLNRIEGLLNKEFSDDSFTFFQSNIEGELIDQIQAANKKFSGIIINPGGYAHTSVAIRDALIECNLPKIEVHLSHIGKREEFRQDLLTASACNGYISGFKENSYLAGTYLLKRIHKKD